MISAILNKGRTSGKQTGFTVALIAILAISASLAGITSISAHTPAWNIPTYSYVSAAPDVIGVGQQVEIVWWNGLAPPTANGAYGDRWQGVMINIVKPDGTNTTLGPFTSDPVGGGYAIYTPTTVGNYTLQCFFPTQVLAGANPNHDPSAASYTNSVYVNDTFLASMSDPTTMVVTQQALLPWVASPLPGNNYWSRPVNGQNREWSFVVSDWLAGNSYDMASKYQPYGIAPNSPHVVWTKPITFGGIAGNQFQDESYYEGYTYESFWNPPIIIQDKLYYNVPTPPIYGWMCVDLKTGQQVWYQNSTGPIQGTTNKYPQLSFGQLLNYNEPNQFGVIPYLWSTYTVNGQATWSMFDAFTGNWICNIVGVPSGTAAVDQNGNILRYQVNTAAGWIALWNTTQCLQYTSPSNVTANGYWEWRPPLAQTVSAITTGYCWNISLPSQIPKNAAANGIDEANQIMLLSTGLPTMSIGNPQFPTVGTYTDAAISLKQGQVGQLLWSNVRNWPAGNVTLMTGAIDGNAYAVFVKETRQWYAYNLTTGTLMWGPSASEGPWDMYLAGVPGSAIAYNTLFTSGYGGTLYAYDLSSGNIKWTYFSGTGPYGDLPYGHYPLWIGAIGDGKIYVYNTEHSPTQPFWRGSAVRCIDVTSGKELWRLEDWGGNTAGGGGNIAIADGYIVDLNSYDNQIYCIGRGQTATTVTYSPVVSSSNTVLIQGTVTDQSPGAKGTPAISDAFMEPWMEYIYEQQAMPTNATGVPVMITALDPNNNVEVIGNVTSDITGNYAIQFTPPVPGMYAITASFGGSNSYFSSSAETHLYVAAASASPAIQPTTPATAPPTVAPTIAPTTAAPTIPPTPTPYVAPPPTSQAPTMTYITIGAVIVIIVAVAAAIALRRRK